jgi:hypothetical protein
MDTALAAVALWSLLVVSCALQYLANESLSQLGKSLGAVKAEASYEVNRHRDVIATMRQVCSAATVCALCAHIHSHNTPF